MLEELMELKQEYRILFSNTEISIYARGIFTAQYVVVLMRANAFTWASGRGLNPGNREFLSPVKWQRAVRQVPFRDEKFEISRVQPPPTCPRKGICPHQNRYIQRRINYTCIGGFMRMTMR